MLKSCPVNESVFFVQKGADMTSDLENALRKFLKPILREVVEEVLAERRLASKPEPKNKKDDSRFLLRAREAAKRLAISERHLHNLTAEGVIPCVRVGRLVHYSVETIERWIQETESKVAPDANVNRKASRKSDDRSSTSTPKLASKQSARRMPSRSSRQLVIKSQNETPIPQRQSEESRADVESEIPNPFRLLLQEIGIERDDLGPLTNGELKKIAEVNTATFHGWMNLRRDLPEEALEKLRQHFRRLISEDEGP